MLLEVASRDVANWGVAWLENQLSDTAARLKRELKVKVGEEQGEWRVWTLGLGPSAAQRVAFETFKSKRAWVRVSRGAVLVSALGPVDWLRIQGEVQRDYDRALKREAEKLSQQLPIWWAECGRRRLRVRFNDTDDDPWVLEDRGDDIFVDARVDLSAVRSSTSKAEIEALAEQHLDSVIMRVGEFLRRPPHY